MPTAMTDSLKVYDLLKAAQISEPQARAITDAIRESDASAARGVHDEVEAWATKRATKTDLVALRSDLTTSIALLRADFKSDLADMTWKMCAFWATQMLALMALLLRSFH
jgi:hypothetical protein